MRRSLGASSAPIVEPPPLARVRAKTLLVDMVGSFVRPNVRPRRAVVVAVSFRLTSRLWLDSSEPATCVTAPRPHSLLEHVTAIAYDGKMESKPISLYVVQARRNLVKIGLAEKPAARLSSLQTGCAERLRLAHTVPVERSLAVAVEQYAHWLLGEFRGGGEWFSVSAERAATAIREAVSAVSDGKRQGYSAGV